MIRRGVGLILGCCALARTVAMGGAAVMNPSPDAEHWVEPGTRLAYPMSYSAYRRTREAQEKSPPRHRGLGPEIDRYVWRRWQRLAAVDVDVVLSFCPGASPRVQRIVGEVLRAIRRGRPAGEAIRHVARRFGLRHGQARAFITAGLRFEVRARHDPLAPVDAGAWSSSSLLADWV
jgi:hypothetical protein